MHPRNVTRFDGRRRLSLCLVSYPFRIISAHTSASAIDLAAARARALSRPHCLHSIKTGGTNSATSMSKRELQPAPACRASASTPLGRRPTPPRICSCSPPRSGR